MLGKGTHGRACAADYRGQAAAANVLTFTDRLESDIHREVAAAAALAMGDCL